MFVHLFVSKRCLKDETSLGILMIKAGVVILGSLVRTPPLCGAGSDSFVYCLLFIGRLFPRSSSINLTDLSPCGQSNAMLRAQFGGNKK